MGSRKTISPKKQKTKISTKMPWTAPPASPLCPVCKKSVFAKEAYMAADRTPFHTFCIKCSQCSKKLTPATINEHEHKLFCPNCYEDLFNMKDECPEKTVMQVLPIQGTFIVEPKINKDEFMTPEELQRRKDMEEAARAWNEAILKTDSGSNTIKIKEACMIAPDDCISI